MKQVAIAGVVLSLALFCAWVVARESQTQTNLVALGQKLDRLAAETSRAQRTEETNTTIRNVVLAAAGTPATAANVPPAAALAPAPAPPKSSSDYQTEMEFAFAQDPAHGSWTSAMQRDAEARLEQAMPKGSSLRSLDCRSTLCRLETQHADDAGFHQFWQHTFLARSDTPLAGPTMTVRTKDAQEADGVPGTWVTYVAIGGAALPSVD